MIEKAKIENLVTDFVKDKGMFLVTVKVSSANKITVLVDTMKGISIDECVSLHLYLEEHLDREVEDYEMQVSSPGLDSPFLVLNQYYKNEGKKVEVIDIEGNKVIGILKNVTIGGFDLDTEIKVKGIGKEMKEISFNFDQVKTTRIVLVFK